MASLKLLLAACLANSVEAAYSHPATFDVAFLAGSETCGKGIFELALFECETVATPLTLIND
jgi:hypothetical protein